VIFATKESPDCVKLIFHPADFADVPPRGILGGRLIVKQASDLIEQIHAGEMTFGVDFFGGLFLFGGHDRVLLQERIGLVLALLLL